MTPRTPGGRLGKALSEASTAPTSASAVGGAVAGLDMVGGFCVSLVRGAGVLVPDVDGCGCDWDGAWSIVVRCVVVSSDYSGGEDTAWTATTKDQRDEIDDGERVGLAADRNTT